MELRPCDRLSLIADEIEEQIGDGYYDTDDECMVHRLPDIKIHVDDLPHLLTALRRDG